MEDLVSLCKRRGFFYPSWQLYGGLQGFYDYGPMGAELRKNLQDTWWQDMVHARDDVLGVHSSILSHRKALFYSGHEDTFHDLMVDCKQCKARWRHDHLTSPHCPDCNSTELTEPRAFNLMFSTQIGPVANNDHKAYLRPETAQGIFTNFKNVLDSQSPKLPFGMAQIGKAFRNEITPRNFIFRVREFEQMELEFFVQPDQAMAWHKYWVETRYNWWLQQGLSADKLRKDQQPDDELAHYAKACVDLVYQYPHGLEELEGIAHRADYDLGAHSKEQSQLALQSKVKDNHDSTARLAMQTPGSKEWQVPFVIEPSCGVERGILAVLSEAYTEESLADGKTRTVLRLRPHLAPVKVAVIPLAKNKPELVTYAKALRQFLQAQLRSCVVIENSGNIGKNYRRHDEIGTPCCITVDFDTLKSTTTDSSLCDTVTVRDRDSLKQHRVHRDELVAYLQTTYFNYQYANPDFPD